MTRYKKGDWVVFPEFNHFPVKLERDGQYGCIEYTLYLGGHFLQVDEKFCQEHGRRYVYCVSDPRLSPPEPLYTSWVESNKIRKATKADLRKTVSALKKSYSRQLAELEKYKTALENYDKR